MDSRRLTCAGWEPKLGTSCACGRPGRLIQRVASGHQLKPAFEGFRVWIQSYVLSPKRWFRDTSKTQKGTRGAGATDA